MQIKLTSFISILEARTFENKFEWLNGVTWFRHDKLHCVFISSLLCLPCEVIAEKSLRIHSSRVDRSTYEFVLGSLFVFVVWKVRTSQQGKLVLEMALFKTNKYHRWRFLSKKIKTPEKQVHSARSITVRFSE